MASLNRRSFLGCVALGTLGLLTKDFLQPAKAMADTNTNNTPKEKYHIYVPYHTARYGGSQTFTLRSGELCQIEIPSRIKETQGITLKGLGQNGGSISVIFHTLYDPETAIKDKIYQEIDRTEFLLKVSSPKKCKSVYEQIEDAEYISNINDFIDLDFLDYIISSSKLDKTDETIKNRWQIASTNSRLLGIEQAIESTLAESELNDKQKKLIRGTFAYVRAGEPVPNFKALTDLNSIVISSTLPEEIKQTYSIATATSRALTVDFILVKLITESALTPEEKNNYLSTYKEVRAGKTVQDPAALKALDSLIEKANIPENAKVVYYLAKQQNLDNQKVDAEKQEAFKETVEQFTNQLRDAKNKGSVLVPQVTKVLTTLGVEAGTGVSITSLSGAAATNATLAFLGGGSVATGGLGMLGGLAVATGGAALIGAAGILSIALVSGMDSEDQKNLGIAIGTGTIAAAGTALAAWTAAGALGVAGTLSGAAAISATISALGGLSMITGGTALIASGTAFLIWSLLKSGKTRDGQLLHQLEARSYTYTENIIPAYVGETIQNVVNTKYIKNGYSAPNIPLDQLSQALSSWLSIHPNEKVISFINTNFLVWKSGLVFTEERLLWTNNSIKYQDLARFVKEEKELYSILSDKTIRKELSQLKAVVDILSDDKYESNLSKLRELIAITNADSKLESLVSLDDKSKLSKLQSAVDILSNDNYNHNLSYLQEVVGFLSDQPDLVRYVPSALVSQLSDNQYQADLSKLNEAVNVLPDYYSQKNLTQLLREIGVKYSTV
ncbi:MAG: hypothetical protein HGA42_15555 [Nostocales cyanobacterium W4_Combined_metabat2_030]|nr:hypothetical protein [Nostocales cyanobacterium W4_Combined_metabat2_030]